MFTPSFHRVFLALLFAVAGLAPAAEASDPTTEVSRIVSRQQEIRVGVESGAGIYGDIPTAKRSELTKRQDSVLQAVSGKQSVDELDAVTKASVNEDLAWIDATVAAAGSEKLVCERRPILGSNRKERVCRTVAQIKREHDTAREQMDSGRTR